MSEVGTHRLTPAGEALRDQLLSKVSKTFQSNRKLKEQIPEIVDRQTIANIKANKLVRLSSLEKFFGSLSRYLNQESTFDSNQHATCPVECVEESTVEANAKTNASGKSQITDIKLKIKIVPSRPNYSVVGVLVRPSARPETMESSGGYNERALVQYLPQLIYRLVSDCGALVPLHELVIEWFLPIELIDLDVEHWTFPNGRFDWPNGACCKAIHIRSYERNCEERYKSCWGNWKNIWRHDRNVDCDAGLIEVSEGQYPAASSRSGCWFISPQQQSEREDLWESLILSGVPVALWTRPSIEVNQARPAILTLLQGKVNELPQNLANQRKVVLSPKKQDRMTDKLPEIAHLSLLWDNPTCPFPNSPCSTDSIDYQSA